MKVNKNVANARVFVRFELIATPFRISWRENENNLLSVDMKNGSPSCLDGLDSFKQIAYVYLILISSQKYLQ